LGCQKCFEMHGGIEGVMYPKSSSSSPSRMHTDQYSVPLVPRELCGCSG
jgi:hypothetical protein